MSSPLGKFYDFERIELAITPTPIEYLANITKALNGPQIYVKRDDLTGLALGGNKARQLEFYMGQAQAHGADTVLTTGAVQSNMVRTTAAAAAKMGFECHLQLEERVSSNQDAYKNSGNVLLNRLFGATIYSFSTGEDELAADKNLVKISKRLMENGRKPYVISLSPGHPPYGALGYIVCAMEILDQISRRTLTIDEIICASGSASTHAGLVFGLRALGSKIKVTGICVRRNSDLQKPRVLKKCWEIGSLLEINQPVSVEDVITSDASFYPGYGQLNKQTLEALKLCASLEGLVLDPVYTAKAFAGLINCIKNNKYNKEQNILFIHTGGQPGLFAYEPQLRDLIAV